MSDHQSSHAELLAQFAEHLAKERYSSVHVERYLAVACKFLRYLKKRAILVESAQPLHVTMYVKCELKRFGRNCEFPALRSHFVVGVKAPPDCRRNGAT